MHKDFDRWNEQQKKIDASATPRVFFHEREIWSTRLGHNIGFEQDGKGRCFLRPVLVLRKFNNEVLWALPLTRRDKPGNPYYARFLYYPHPEVAGPPLHAIAILSQLRLIDGKRLRYKIGTVPADEFVVAIKEKVRRLLA
jgi:mRNA interferase MazF